MMNSTFRKISFANIQIKMQNNTSYNNHGVEHNLLEITAVQPHVTIECRKIFESTSTKFTLMWKF